MKIITAIACLFITAAAVAQQGIQVPRESQYSQVLQRIGITDITITYHSPAVNDRIIWGKLVPYDQVWRAGANENTTITFTTDVTVNKQPLPAGTYGLHMIPRTDTWTVIFSKNYKAWGSFSYKQEEDALRIEVQPQPHAFTQWLTYNFTTKADESATVELSWDKLAVAFNIAVDVKNTTYENIKQQLNNLEKHTWSDWYTGAAYCYTNNIHLDEGEKWLAKADEAEPKNYTIYILKARYATLNGNTKEAEQLNAKALEYATEDDLNSNGYSLMGSGKIKEAIEIFRMNAKRHPDSWNVHDSLAEALEKNGDTKEAITEYETALKNSPPETQKKRIEDTLKRLKSK